MFDADPRPKNKNDVGVVGAEARRSEGRRGETDCRSSGSKSFSSTIAGTEFMDLKDGVGGVDLDPNHDDDGGIVGAIGGDCRYDGDEDDFLCRDFLLSV